jgi:ribosome maturation protein SDO1
MGIGKNPMSYDKERVNFNLARLKKGGRVFEIVVDPDNAILFKRGTLKEIRDVIKSEKIFADAKKGIFASEPDMMTVFESKDVLKVAGMILKDGEIQLTTEYRDQLRADKKKKIIAIIHMNAMDPKTKLPHPLVRIENAIEEAKVKIDELKTAEEQVDDVVKKLRTILPIKIEQLLIEITVPPQYAHQAYGTIKKMGELKGDSWQSDGTLIANLQIPAGLQEEVLNKLNSLTHGSVEIKIIKEL